ncbi:MAG: serine hydrolase [Brachymonas sp.]|nr:serine hydrolase [Brachymonas sp.]
MVRVSIPARNPFTGGDSRLGVAPELHSSVAFVMDQNTGQVLLNKNGSFVSPIASITKLMTALITMDANLPMDEMITITEEDVDRVKRSSSRLAVGTTLSRQDMLQLALMSSENRAAHALGRTYPGGLEAAIRAMNNRALMLGMRETRYVEPTGLSSSNQSSARDLALLVRAAYRYPLVRNYTTYPGAEFPVAGRMQRYNNTNRLIHSADWDIGLQKTGYISEAGRCVVMQSNISGRNVIIVLLDSAGTNRRVEDAESIRYWVRSGGAPSQPGGGRVVAQTAGGVF